MSVSVFFCSTSWLISCRWSLQILSLRDTGLCLKFTLTRTVVKIKSKTEQLYDQLQVWLSPSQTRLVFHCHKQAQFLNPCSKRQTACLLHLVCRAENVFSRRHKSWDAFFPFADRSLNSESDLKSEIFCTTAENTLNITSVITPNSSEPHSTLICLLVLLLLCL